MAGATRFPNASEAASHYLTARGYPDGGVEKFGTQPAPNRLFQSARVPRFMIMMRRTEDRRNKRQPRGDPLHL